MRKTATRKLTTQLARKSPRTGRGLYYDPLYGYIPIHRDIRRVIDLEVFQRLRGIRQLSTVYLVFPGANHTRFEHSIGVSYLAQIAHEQLKTYLEESSDPSLGGVVLDAVTARLVELAGLLHDIGHGPYGHVFELFCHRERRFQTWDHEHWGEQLITGRRGESADPIPDAIFQQIPTYIRDLQRSLALRHGESPTLPLLTPENVANLAYGRPPVDQQGNEIPEYYFLKDIVPSTFGIDRLDYLRRDAFYTGLKTGEVDIWEIIGNMHLRFVSSKCELYLFPSAAPAVESLVRARDAVYRQLYHNPVHRSAQELIVRALLQLNQNPEDIAFLSDAELLDAFANSEIAFPMEVEERIRFRLLYEVHSLGHHIDIHAFERTVESYSKDENGWQKFLNKESQIGADAGMIHPHRPIFDLEMVPAIKGDDLTLKFFFDPSTQKCQSLAEILPHLATLFVGDAFGNVTKVHAYNDSVSNFYVAFPYDHISDDIDRIARDTNSDAASPASASPSSASPASDSPALGSPALGSAALDTPVLDSTVQNLYSKKIEPLVTGFFSKLLEIEDPNPSDKKLIEDIAQRSQKRLVYYLHSLVKLRRNDIRSELEENFPAEDAS